MQPHCPRGTAVGPCCHPSLTVLLLTILTYTVALQRVRGNGLRINQLATSKRYEVISISLVS